MQIRLLIADDHPIFLDGLRRVIESAYPEIKVVATARDGEEAVKQAEETRPDVAVLDIRMPKLSGIGAARQIRSVSPDTKILMLTTFNESELVLDSLKTGAMGYILKEKPIDEVVSAVKAIFEGSLIVTAKAAQAVDWVSGDRSQAGPWPATPVPELADLSDRERDVLRLLIQGRTNEQISSELFLSYGTVRNYVSRIYATLDVQNRASLMLWAIHHGLS